MWLALGCLVGVACALVVAGAGVHMAWRVLAAVVFLVGVLAAVVLALIVGGPKPPAWDAAWGAVVGFVGSLAFDALRVGWVSIVKHYRAGSKQ